MSFLSDVLTIAASGIAIFLFVSNRQELRSILDVLLGYSLQITFSELKLKLDKLNALNADDTTQKVEVINILNEVVGQISGNRILKNTCDDILVRLERVATAPKILTEAKKRSLVSELRETIRNVEFRNLNASARREK